MMYHQIFNRENQFRMCMIFYILNWFSLLKIWWWAFAWLISRLIAFVTIKIKSTQYYLFASLKLNFSKSRLWFKIYRHLDVSTKEESIAKRTCSSSSHFVDTVKHSIECDTFIVARQSLAKRIFQSSSKRAVGRIGALKKTGSLSFLFRFHPRIRHKKGYLFFFLSSCLFSLRGLSFSLPLSLSFFLPSTRTVVRPPETGNA